jgi:predicted secreted protein
MSCSKDDSTSVKLKNNAPKQVEYDEVTATIYQGDEALDTRTISRGNSVTWSDLTPSARQSVYIKVEDKSGCTTSSYSFTLVDKDQYECEYTGCSRFWCSKKEKTNASVY